MPAWIHLNIWMLLAPALQLMGGLNGLMHVEQEHRAGSKLSPKYVSFHFEAFVASCQYLWDDLFDPILDNLNFFFQIFYFTLEYSRLTVLWVSGRQQRDSIIHIHVSILPQIPLPSRQPHNIEQRTRCCTVGACWLFIISIAACACPNSLTIPSPFRTLYWLESKTSKKHLNGGIWTILKFYDWKRRISPCAKV